MVCVDGFILTHAFERVDLPTQEQVDEVLPPFVPRQVLDPSDPVSIGAMVGPEAFTEVRYLSHARLQQALSRLPVLAARQDAVFGRSLDPLVRTYRTDDAELVVVAMGSVLGTLKDVVDELREEGHRVGVVGITCFRPFPAAAVREALGGARRVVVVEKHLSTGVAGVLATDLLLAMGDRSVPLHTVVAGLGGRPVRTAAIATLLRQAVAGDLAEVTVADLQHDLVDAELERSAAQRRSGPSAENVLRDLGYVAQHGR